MVKIVGHRGFRAKEPENTLMSFRSALKQKVDAIEFDLRLTKDNKIILFHDPVIDKKTDGKGKIKEMTFNQLKKFYVINKTKKDRITLFKDVLKFAKKKKIELIVELKEVGFEKTVLSLLKRYGLLKRSVIVSFLEKALKNVRKCNKRVRTGLIYVKPKNHLKLAKKLKVNFIIPCAAFLYKPYIEKAHQENLKVLVWTLNNPKVIKKFISYGVDYIATDRPDIAVKVKKRLKMKK